MTEATDTKALRERLIEQLDHMECYGGNGWVSQEEIRFILSELDQLEAERQRVADEQELNKHLDLANRASEGVNANLRRQVEKAEAELAELRGEQEPVAAGTSDQCSPDVYEKGVTACVVAIPKETAEEICRGITASSGVSVDWHYVGGRVHIKTLRTIQPKPVVVLPAEFFNAVQNSRGMFELSENCMCGITTALQGHSIVVKDGE